MTGYRLVNAAWQLGGDAALIRRASTGVSVLALVECRDRHNDPVDVDDILGPQWRTVQDTRNAARSGVALAVRRASGIDVVRHKLRPGSPGGRDVQARPILDVTLDVPHRPLTRLGVGHRPLVATTRTDEFDAAARAFARRCRNQRRRRAAAGRPVGRWAFLGDVNQRPAAFARTIGAPHVFGADVMAFAYSTGWSPSLDLGARPMARTDHNVLTIREAAY